MADVTSIVDTYLAMWNEEDGGRRRELIATAWREDGRYVDPLQEAEGHDAIDAMVAALQGQMPGHRFTRTSAVDVHHDELRFGWQLAAPDGAVRAHRPRHHVAALGPGPPPHRAGRHGRRAAPEGVRAPQLAHDRPPLDPAGHAPRLGAHRWMGPQYASGTKRCCSIGGRT